MLREELLLGQDFSPGHEHDLPFVSRDFAESRTWTAEKWDNLHTVHTPSPFIYFYIFLKCFYLYLFILRMSTCQLSGFFLVIVFGKPRNFADSDTAEYHQLEISFWGREFIYFTPFLSVLNCKGWKIESYATIRPTNMPMLAMLYDGFSEL